jgi:plastocyanin
MRKTVLAALLVPALALTSCAATPAPGTAAAQVTKFTVQGSKRVAGPDRVEVTAGAAVTIEVTSDVADELHVHGYDKAAELAAGIPGSVTFTADVPGLFEVELHHSGAKLTQLRVGK